MLVKVHMDNHGRWQPSNYVSHSTPIVLDTDHKGNPLASGVVKIRRRGPDAVARRKARRTKA